MTLLEELKERRDRQEEVLDEVAEAIKEREEYRLRVEQVLDDLDLAIAALQPGEIEITVTNDEPDLPTPIVNTDEGWELEPSPAELFEAEKSEAREQLEREPEIPEGFTKWDGGECPLPVGTRFDMICRACGPWHDMEVLADSTLEWQHTGRDLDIIAYRIIEASPAPDPDEQDDASEFAEPMPDPEFVVLDEQTCEPVEEAPALNEAMQDERELTAQNDYDTTGVLTADDMQGGAMPNFAEYPAPVTEGYAPVVDAPVTNPEADALARAHDWYSPEKVAERNKFNPWGIFGKKLEDA